MSNNTLDHMPKYDMKMRLKEVCAFSYSFKSVSRVYAIIEVVKI